MPDEVQFLGYLVLAIITLGGFFSVIERLTKPVNDLRLVIQELKVCIETLKNNNEEQNKKIAAQEQDISDLKLEVNNLKTKVGFYHKD